MRTLEVNFPYSKINFIANDLEIIHLKKEVVLQL